MMGFQLGKTSLRYKSIRPTIVIHILFNLLIYTLCVMPAAVTRYMAYALATIVIIAGYLMISGRYERIRIQKLRSNRITNVIFYSRPTIVIAMLLMVVDSLLHLFLS